MPLRITIPRRYDNKASDLTKAGMKDGVSKTSCFLLFLSAGVMARPYVQVIRRFVVRAPCSFGVTCLLPLCPDQFELRTAIELGKKIVLVHGESNKTRTSLACKLWDDQSCDRRAPACASVLFA